ncbi:MAG: hypothetical protein LBS84_12125 [Clostridiales bacterium]|nr:hypothetical protein [Clostridiales bacterium]
MQTGQALNKNVYEDNTFNYVGTLYKLIASAATGELLYGLVEGKPSGKMLVLPLDNIVNIIEENIVIDSREALQDFETFGENAKGEFLIIDDHISAQPEIKKAIADRVAAKAEARGRASYFTFMNYENAETEQYSPVTTMTATAVAERPQPLESSQLNEREARLRSQEELLRAEEIRLKREFERKYDELRQLELNIENEMRVLQKLIDQRKHLSPEENDLARLFIRQEERLKLASQSQAMPVSAKPDLGVAPSIPEPEKNPVIDFNLNPKAQIRSAGALNTDFIFGSRKAAAETNTPDIKPTGVKMDMADLRSFGGTPVTAEVKHSIVDLRPPEVKPNFVDLRPAEVEPNIADIRPVEVKPNIPDINPIELKPVQAVNVPVAENPRPIEESTDPIQNFINKQRRDLLGKTVTKNINDREGNILLNAGTVITDTEFDKVVSKNKDSVIELAMYAE